MLGAEKSMPRTKEDMLKRLERGPVDQAAAHPWTTDRPPTRGIAPGVTPAWCSGCASWRPERPPEDSRRPSSQTSIRSRHGVQPVPDHPIAVRGCRRRRSNPDQRPTHQASRRHAGCRSSSRSERDCLRRQPRRALYDRRQSGRGWRLYPARPILIPTIWLEKGRPRWLKLTATSCSISTPARWLRIRFIWIWIWI